MRFHRTRWVHFVLLFLPAVTLHAQEITGNCQGTLAGKFRVVRQITNNADGKLQGNLYRIDQSPHSIPVTTLSFVSPILKLTIDALGVSYEGALGTDGKAITGTLTSVQATPLILERATPETAWKLYSSPHTIQMASVERGVTLEVLDWGGSGRPLVLLTGLGDTAHVFDEFAPKLSAGSARTNPSRLISSCSTNASMTRHMWSAAISSSSVTGNMAVCSRASPWI